MLVPVADVAVLLPTIRGLTERQHQLFFFFQTAIARDTPGGFAVLDDDDVADGGEAGATTDVIVMRSKFGVTGTDSRPQLLKHSQFVDYNVRILGKHGRNNWAPMQTVQIERVAMSR